MGTAIKRLIRRKQASTKHGFTFLEILLVMLIVGILTTLAISYTQTTQLSADISTQVKVFASYVRLAQSDAASGKNNSDHGIHLAPDSFTVFQGSVYNSSDTSNFTIELPATIVIQNIALNGGGNDIIFTRPNGETTTHGTLEFSSTEITKIIPLTLSQLGTLTY